MQSSLQFGFVAALFALLGLAACAHDSGKPATTPAGPKPEEKPASASNLDGMLKREVTTLSEVSVNSPAFRARVLSKGDASVTVEEGVAKLVVPLGTDAPVHCFVYEKDPDPGSAFSALMTSLAEELELNRLIVGPIDVIREAPVPTLAAFYTTQTPKGRALGELKLAFHTRFGGTSLCLHDELGYEKTFLSVARSLFESLDRGPSPLAPTYVEVSTAEVNGRPAGYERFMVLPEQNGERQLVATGLALLITEPNVLVTQDYGAVTAIDADHRIVSAHYTEAKNGKLTLDVRLKRATGRNYEYQGSHAGRNVSGTLVAADERGLPSSLWTQRELAKRLAQGGPFEFSIQQYRPSEDPSRLARIGYQRRADDPPGGVLIKTGRVEALAVLDEHGREQRSEMRTQGISVVMKSIYRRGD